MQYPQLRQKIEILNKKYGIDPASISKKIQKDKSTAWRWLYQSTDRLPDEAQQALVLAVCEDLTIDIGEKDFRSNNILRFCLRAGLTKFEAAVYCGFSLPIPDIIIDSLFDMSDDFSKYIGSYLVFRHDKERARQAEPYLQACATISANERDLLIYEDAWADGSTRKLAYHGFVYPVGNIINIVGGSKSVGKAARAEIWWCGLKVGRAGQDNNIELLYGYVSDLTYGGVLFTDRTVLVRTTPEEWDGVRRRGEYFVPRERVIDLAGAKFTDYLDEWQNVSIAEPARF